MLTHRRPIALLAATLGGVATLLVLFCTLARPHPTAAGPRVPAVAVSAVDPASGPNDLDTPIVITGTDFAEPLTVTLGTTSLDDVGWISTTTLTATVPWGLDPGVYTLTVENPDGGSAGLTDAFTVTEAIGVWNPGEFYGGSVDAVLVNPITPTTLYAASERVGVFRSRDSAQTWSFVASSNDVRHFAMAPADPDTLYTWIGRQQTYGLHRSDDGGDTWTELDVDGDRAFPHPEDPDTVYVAKDSDSGGLWRSSNRGLTWTSITDGLTDTHVTALAFHPTDPLTVVAGTSGGNLFLSSNGGDDWSFVDQPTNFVQTLAFNSRGDHELWVSNCCFCNPRETLRSTDASLTAWTTVANPVGSNSMQAIAFPPADWGGSTYSQTVFVNSCWGECHRSDDRGASWSPFGPTTGGWGLALHPTDPDVAYRSSSWDGVIETTDGRASWQVVNEGLTAVVPEQLEIVPNKPDTLYARTGRPDGIYKGTLGGMAWRFQTIPTEPNTDSSTVLVDPVTPTRVYAGEWGMEQVTLHISQESGETWGTPVSITVTEAFTDCPSFINTLAVHETRPGALVMGIEHMCMGVPGFHAGDIYYSTDAGRSWELATISGMETISPVVSIVHDELTPTTLYAATSWDHQAHGLLRSTDGGQGWEPIGQDVSALDDVYDLAVEKAPPYRIFAWAGAAHSLYVSTDHGDTWAKASAPLNGYHVEEILCTDEDPSWLYAAVSQSWHGPGLYRSRDGAQSWERATGELGRVPVYSIDSVRADDRVVLYAGTTGGEVQDTETQVRGMRALAATAAGEKLVNAGVYRNTTLRSRQPAPEQPGWVQVAEGGFDDPGNFIIISLASFEGSLYAGTMNDGGAELWQSDDGSTWQQVTAAWSPTNTAILALQQYGSHLYLGTGAGVGPDSPPGDLWRTDGISWTHVVSDGLGDANNRGIVALDVFSDALYAGVDNPTTGLEIWRSETGDPGTWSQVNADSFGEPGVARGNQMGVYSDTLYAGANRDGAAELWRSDDGVNWTPVFTDGLGNADNTDVASLATFDGSFYVGFRNNTAGAEVWRLNGEGSWTKIFEGGLGNPDNKSPSVLVTFGEQLHAAFNNSATGVEAWSTADGSAWGRTNLNGWGNSNNTDVGGATVFNHALYVGSFNWNQGAEVWRYGFTVYLPLTMMAHAP